MFHSRDITWLLVVCFWLFYMDIWPLVGSYTTTHLLHTTLTHYHTHTHTSRYVHSLLLSTSLPLFPINSLAFSLFLPHPLLLLPQPYLSPKETGIKRVPSRKPKVQPQKSIRHPPTNGFNQISKLTLFLFIFILMCSYCRRLHKSDFSVSASSNISESYFCCFSSFSSSLPDFVCRGLRQFNYIDISHIRRGRGWRIWRKYIFFFCLNPYQHVRPPFNERYKCLTFKMQKRL